MRSELPFLTKSDYLAGLTCVKQLFLRKYGREHAAVPSMGALARMADGQEIGLMARTLFPGGILIDSSGKDAVLATQINMEQAHTLFEAQFVSDGRLVRVDVLQRDGDGWRLIEVKSSKEPNISAPAKPVTKPEQPKEKFKDQHFDDVAFQVLVLREAGVNVKSAALMLLSRSYQAGADGGCNLTKLFAIRDVTAEVEERIMDAQFHSIRLVKVLALDEAPDVETNTFCKDCGFHDYCHKDQRPDDLALLPRIRSEDVTRLRRDGIYSIGAIPDDFKLSPLQSRVREVQRTHEPFVDERLAEDLQAIRYPFALIDFETTKWVIPFLPKTSAHQAIPFQWSCHLVASPGAEPVHKEFLYRGGEDPRLEFAQTLLDCVRGAATVGTYTQYESTVINDLVRNGIANAKELQSILAEKGLDLKKLVENRVYLEEFVGSFSLKKVLPALSHEHGYGDLRIQDGEAASAEYKRMSAETTPPEEANSIARDLLAYCQRDTEAMVVLLNALHVLAQTGKIAAKPSLEPNDLVHDQLALNI
jgi:hypothetical protein